MNLTGHKPEETERFSVRSQPTAYQPTPRPIPSAMHSSFGAWIDRIYSEALAFQNLGGASDLAVTLTATQRQKLAELIEFLQSVA